MTTAERIDAFLAAHLDRYINETIRLCAQPSISARGEGVHECAPLVAAILAGHGFRVQQVETPYHPIIIAHAEGASDRTFLFYNHYDVQPPEPLDLWTTPPFEPTIHDGALYARGTNDDKGQMMARIAAVDAVRAAYGGSLPCNVTFLVEGDEESGSPYIAQFVMDHLDDLRCDAAVWEEGGIDLAGRPTNLLGTRGMLAVELSVETLARDVHSGAAHRYPSAAWRLTWALAALKGPDERVLIPGFYDDAKPPSARDRELIAAGYNPDEEAWAREKLGVRDFVRGMTGVALDEAVFHPTCNVQGITTGYQGVGTKTIVPARASAKVDIRLVPDQNPEDILAKLRAHLDTAGFADVQIHGHSMAWPYKLDAGHPLVAITSRAGEEVYGKPARLIPLNGGTSPQYALDRPFNIPIVRAGTSYPDMRTHAPDEHVRLVDFHNGARHIARILDGFARNPW